MSTVAAGPTLGPCSAWTSGSDVAACCGIQDCDPPSLLDTVALEASMALYELSGRRFTGGCEQTVRPCSQSCSCWGQQSAGLGPWYWMYGVPWGTGGSGWGWQNDCGDSCGCSRTSRIPLVYPTTSINAIKIGGDLLLPFDENGNPNYRLDNWRWLTRMDDPGPPLVKREWPGCQNLSLDDTEPGTFSVSYTWGVAPPQLGIDAAAELACELFRACSSQNCALPANAVRIQRQGVTVERNIVLAFLADPTKTSGLLHLDLFLSSYGIKGRGRVPALWSPDLQQMPRRVGTG